MRPYNTRHKTLSLHSLGIHVPGTHASRAATVNRASPASTTNSASPASMASPAPTQKDGQPPAKRQKRERANSEGSNGAPAFDRLPKKRDDGFRLENTPPPSPPAARPSIETSDDDATAKTIDMESINDEIVEAVIVQLQNTANRPHLVKELATVLMQQLKIVQQSANPCAIISSRLATFLKRPGWSAASPCPLAKELESVHPRRTYFYLTTCPRQPLPDPAQTASLSHLAHTRGVLSPSPSSGASNSAEESDLERRRELSPSPEVDLSSPEFDDMDDDFAMPSTPIGSFSLRGFYMPPRLAHSGTSRSNRAASPPLEKDEKEFTQTADGLQKRKLNGELLSATTAPPEQTTTMDLEKEERALFAVMSAGASMSSVPPPMSLVSSPAIRPSTVSLNSGRKDGEVDSWTKFEGMLEWDRSPETIELEELDGLLDDY
ncbi:hypothetical protein VTK26DRAFT_5683 [Humicola hyalothermophila]